ncbi:hypothetical protein D3C77_702530 [compost metagenome]
MQYARAKMLDNLLQRRTPRLHHPPSSLIGIHHMYAETSEVVGRRSLAAANTAGQTENPRLHQHIHAIPMGSQ